MRLLFCLIVVAFALSLAACGGGSDPSPTSTPSRAPVSSTPTRVTSPTPTRMPPLPTATPTIGSLAIVNARIFDGNGGEPIESGYVIVRDGYIVEVGAGEGDLPSDAHIIDAQGLTLMPGLGDAHTHTTLTYLQRTGLLGFSVNEDAYVPFIQAGFTDLRDVGTATIITEPIKLQTDGLTARGKAPRITWAGPIITAPGGYPCVVPTYAGSCQEVTSIDNAVDLVDLLDSRGARVIKLGLEHGYYSDEGWPVLDLDTVQAITAAAHERGMRVTAHVTSLDEVRLAIDGGVDDLAHTPLQPLTDDLIAEMLDHNMGMVTTATIWGGPGDPQNVAAENAIRYNEAGGLVAVGTDFGCCAQIPGGSAYLNEADFLAALGFPLDDLLVAETRNPAIFANSGDDTGTIEPGKLADMIMIEGDPLANARAISNVEKVILGGQVVFER